jgi:hypothetical protein
MSDPFKLCHNCVYAITPRYETPMFCSHSACKTINPVTGEDTPQSTFWARSTAGPCQIDAKLFEQKEPK